MNKCESYSRNDLVARYEERRFHGRSGEFVNLKELESVYRYIARYVKKDQPVLDFPCGTGRLDRFLKQRAVEVIGADYSEAMLRRARNEVAIPFIRADAFRIPFKDSMIGCVASLRFLFHYREVEPFFQEVGRILKEDGVFIFDTFKWSPRAFSFLNEKRVYVHSTGKIRKSLARMGMDVVEERHSFFFSPMLYKRLPFPAVQFLNAMERIAPSWLLVRVFWCVRKNRSSGIKQIGMPEAREE